MMTCLHDLLNHSVIYPFIELMLIFFSYLPVIIYLLLLSIPSNLPIHIKFYLTFTKQ